MDKYYLAKLLSSQSDAFDQQLKIKLVEINYARRPPSFGVVYLEQRQQTQTAAGLSAANQPILGQHINLAAFELADNHVAKFHVVKRTDFSSTVNAGVDQIGDATGAPGFLVDFDTNKEILMDTSSHHHQQQQQQQLHQQSSKADSDASGKQLPHCVALADDGFLFAVHLIDGHIKRLTGACDKQQHSIQLLSGSGRGSEANFLECKLLNFNTDLMENYCLIYVLAERFYSVYKLTKENLREGKLELISGYSLLQSSHHYGQFDNSFSKTSATNTRNAANSATTAHQRFSRMFVVESNPQVLLAELNDFSVKIFQNSTCLATLNINDSLGSSISPRQHLVVTGKSNDEAVLLSYSKSRIVMHSFRINLESSQQQSLNVSTTDLASHRYDRHISNNSLINDPDQLLPREPSFEVEMCWSINLNDIDSIRSSDDAEDDNDDESNDESTKTDDKDILAGHQQAIINCNNSNTSPGCLCSMWSVYSFEQQPELPFSVVYDRSFLKLIPLNEALSSSPATASMPATLTVASSSTKDGNIHQEYIDIKLKPKLLHNFKLIGSQPSDSLFNTLFLVSKANLIKQRHFPQLGLLVSLSNAGDVMAFKFTSNKIITQKDGLYQQQICDSIRCDSLLKDQIERIQVSNNLLRDDIFQCLEMQSNSANSSNQFVERLDNLLRVELKHCEQIGGLYELKISISNLVGVSRILVTLTVNSKIIKPSSLNSSIQSIYIENNAGGCQSSCDTTPIMNNHFRLPGILLASIGQKEITVPDSGEYGDDEEEENHYDYDYEELILRKHQQLTRLNNDDNNGVDTSNGGPNQHSPTGIKSWAMIEPNSNAGNSNLMLTNKSQMIQLVLPLFMMDGQSGQVQVFYLLGNSDHSESSNSIRSHLFAESHLHQQQHKRSGRNSVDNSILRFHSKSIRVKPLMSYKPSSHQLAPAVLKAERNSNNSIVVLNISGLFKMTMMLDWLYECIPDELLNQQQGIQQSEQAAVIGGDDLIALETIKKHILKRATDKSIKLDINQSRQSNSTIMHSLRHLIELQYINLSVCSKLMKESDAIQKQRSERNITEELHLIMESLIGDKNQMDDFPIELTPSDDAWFEISLKQDLIRLAGKTQAQTPESKPTDEIVDSEASILKGLVCDFICNTLVEFDKLQGLRHSGEAIQTLLKRLSKSINEYDKFSFVDKVLNDWNESKKSQKT